MSSTVGIRSSWVCAYCGAPGEAHQIAIAADQVRLEAPHGWKVHNNRAICDAHVVTLTVEQRPALKVAA